MLKKILIGLAVLLLILVGVTATRPSGFRYDEYSPFDISTPSGKGRDPADANLRTKAESPVDAFSLRSCGRAARAPGGRHRRVV